MAEIRHHFWDRWDGAKMLEEIEKVEGGSGIISRLFINGELVMATRSSRPYKLGQACDGTICQCVGALFWHFCKTRGYDPVALLNEAYGEGKDKWDWEMIRKQGEWEGIELPKRWDKRAFRGLIESLTEINYHSLVGLLEEKYK